jgi:predicted GIY-YIG superfamily endonuclease
MTIKKNMYIYVLKLELDSWYVGTSNNLIDRITAHASKSPYSQINKDNNKVLSTQGLTGKRKAVNICNAFTMNCSDQQLTNIENMLTALLAKEYGYEFVRGGTWFPSWGYNPKESITHTRHSKDYYTTESIITKHDLKEVDLESIADLLPLVINDKININFNPERITNYMEIKEVSHNQDSNKDGTLKVDHLEIKITGEIKSSNFHIWKENLLAQISSTTVKLVTDNDFLIASEDVKTLKKAENATKEAKIKAIQQTEEIQLLFSGLDEISALARQTRLSLERQVRIKKKEIKSSLIDDAIECVLQHIKTKPPVYMELDYNKHLQRHKFESTIKGKSTITSVEHFLNLHVEHVKAEIDSENEKTLTKFSFIEAIPLESRLLFPDVSYLLTLPDNELKLVIENRIVKFSEQNSHKDAQEIKNELNTAVQFDDYNEQKNNYVVSIEILASRSDAINIARELKKHLSDSDALIDIKLAIKCD